MDTVFGQSAPVSSGSSDEFDREKLMLEYEEIMRQARDLTNKSLQLRRKAGKILKRIALQK
jgi:hypothetical protein